jgi:hypothetical protein
LFKIKHLLFIVNCYIFSLYLFQIKLLIVALSMVKATYKQTCIGIWFHGNSFLSNLQDKMKLYLNQTFYYYRIFVNEDDFYTYIDEERLTAKIFLIISTLLDSSLDCLIRLINIQKYLKKSTFSYLQKIIHLLVSLLTT